MTARATPSTPSLAPAIALPGTWKLARGQAFTLRPPTDGILRVAHGRLWATRQGPHGCTPEDAGDHILEAGRSMYVRAGERVVVEAWSAGGGGAHFAWDAVLAPRASAARLNFSLVRQPLAELRLAAGLVLHALAALAKGLAQVGWQALRGSRRGRPPQGACC